MRAILAIDGGGTRTRCSAIDECGNTLGTVEAGASNHLLVDIETVTRSLSESIDGTLIQCGLQRSDVVCISAGLAGVDYDGAGEEEMRMIMRGFGFDHVVINGDMVIAHAGALAGNPGVIALAGTGSAILGIAKDGKRVKVGGWGPVFGDEGSAYRIGQMALRAAARDFDGRGERTTLTEAILRAFRISDFKETLNAVYSKHLEIREIAALSRPAYEAAESGDAVAVSIFTQAGEELAEGVSAAIGRLSLHPEETLISYQGSVLESCSIVRESFREELLRCDARAQIVSPRHSPIVGAYLLGRSSLGMPNNEHILNRLSEQGGDA